jgi:dienelactone hydrolase
MKLITFALVFSCCLNAQQPFSVPKSDAPQLAGQGSYAVGVKALDLVHKDQVDILKFDQATGKAPLYDRPLKVEVWYPATLAPGQTEQATYEGLVGSTTYNTPGKAARDATPVKGQKFPLVVVSHGYPGSRFFLSYLTENLASKGYVVAAIDHTDSVVGAVRPFTSTLLNRSNDQLFVIDSLKKLLAGQVDEKKIAIVGYSMGGYGALISAGAPISASSALNNFVPGGYLAKYKALQPEGLKAVVAIAPWGEQPPFVAWDADSLAGIHLPTLFIVGDHDDVAGYENGPKRAMELAVNSDRCLLVYENARHNTGGNPPPAGMALDYKGEQSLDEPVWRKDRIAAINQHFITAFLDLYLKNDESKRAFLHVPMTHSNDGKWLVAPNTPDDGAFSKGNDFWPGFQRRWALGLEMTCLASK